MSAGARLRGWVVPGEEAHETETCMPSGPRDLALGSAGVHTDSESSGAGRGQPVGGVWVGAPNSGRKQLTRYSAWLLGGCQEGIQIAWPGEYSKEPTLGGGCRGGGGDGQGGRVQRGEPGWLARMSLHQT